MYVDLAMRIQIRYLKYDALGLPSSVTIVPGVPGQKIYCLGFIAPLNGSDVIQFSSHITTATQTIRFFGAASGTNMYIVPFTEYGFFATEPGESLDLSPDSKGSFQLTYAYAPESSIGSYRLLEG